MDAALSGQEFEEVTQYYYTVEVAPSLYLSMSNVKITLQWKPSRYHFNQVIKINIISYKTYLLPDMMH